MQILISFFSVSPYISLQDNAITLSKTTVRRETANNYTKIAKPKILKIGKNDVFQTREAKRSQSAKQNTDNSDNAK